jgi:hypothetical protein
MIGETMPLTMRPCGLASTGYYKDHADYLIFCGGWDIGRICEIRGGPEHLRWFWALHARSKPEILRTHNRTGDADGRAEAVDNSARFPHMNLSAPCIASGFLTVDPF